MSTSLLLISDHSKEKLQEVPSKVLEMSNLKMLFLEGNFLYKLPEDFFWKLPRLVWLDLRNNQLEAVPKSIAYHDYLENLLLTNNNLKALPNELGLVPKLKALQVSENPLIYPSKKVIVEGTKGIRIYLKQQYEKELQAMKLAEQQKREEQERQPEELIAVEDFTYSDDVVNEKPKTRTKKSKDKEPPKEVKENIKNRLSDPRVLRPTLNVKRLSDPIPETPESRDMEKNEPMKIVHKITRRGKTISLTSELGRLGMMNMARESVNSYREGWLNQLRILLTDQEKILQQERTLKALADWRSKKNSQTPKVFYDESAMKMKAPPFATYPEYAKMPTREALANQLNNFIKEKSISCPGVKNNSVDMDKLINDMVEQLKEMEVTYSEMRSPRSEVAAAERQIRTITDIHKKLLKLKTQNIAKY